MDGPITRERFQQLEERIQFLESEMAMVLKAANVAAIMNRFSVGPGIAKLIQALYQAKGRVLDEGRLMDAIGSNGESGKVVQTYVCRARKALGAFDTIQTVRNMGFRLTETGKEQLDQIAA